MIKGVAFISIEKHRFHTQNGRSYRAKITMWIVLFDAKDLI